MRDLRSALRMLIKNPGFSTLVVVALGLGMGVNSAVFGGVNLYLMRPLPVVHPEELAAVFMGSADQPRVWGPLSYPDYLDLKAEKQIFSAVVAATMDNSALTDDRTGRGGDRSHAQTAVFELASGNMFQVLGVRPVLGRVFAAPEADAPAGDSVAVLSYTFWQRRFGGDPGVLGRRIFLGHFAATVIGVVPRGFMGPEDPVQFGAVDCWIPLAQRASLYQGTDPGFAANRAQRLLRVFARLQPGLSPADAQARLGVLARTLAGQYPKTNSGTRFGVTSEIEGRYGEQYGMVRLGFLAAAFVAALVLLVSCANVANLLLARAAARTRELGIRVALGAGRGRIIRQLLTESLLLSLLGGAVGLVLARWFGDCLRALMPPMEFQPTLDFPTDLRTFAWSLGAAVLAGVGFGAAPAWRASQTDVVSALKTDAGAEGQRIRRLGLRQILVIAQMAITVVVLVTGGLFFRSLKKIERIDPGYRTENLVSALVNPSIYTDDQVRMGQFFTELQRRLAAHPGVRAVSSARYMPLVNQGGTCAPVVRDGAPPPPPNQSPPINYSVVYSGYFQTAGTQLLLGRDFTEDEHQGPPATVIINAELARRLFGRVEDALGRRLWVAEPTSPRLRVVGIARDGRYQTLLEDPRPWMFVPASLPWLHDTNEGMRTVLIRAADRTALPAITAALRAEVERLDARIPLEQLLTAEQHLAVSLFAPRLAAELGTILGALALLLATMGIFSVMTYTVSQRRKEIGIRVALGGQRADILRLVMVQGLALVALGLGAGALMALALGRLLARFIIGVSAADPLTFLAAAALLLLVSALATLIPARRATRVDPMLAMRQQ
jgi:predicted permease